MARITITPEMRANRPLLEAIRAALVFENPAYKQALRRAGFPPRNIRRDIRLYHWDEATHVLSVPRGFCAGLVRLLYSAGIPCELLSQSTWGDIVSVSITSKIQPRPYQLPAIDAACQAGNGMLIAPCGSGKTTMGLEIIARLAHRALWVTHTTRLANQTREQIKTLLGVDQIGLIADGMASNLESPITVAMVQTLARFTPADWENVRHLWGSVVFDEAHHLPADSFANVANQLPARYRFGLTANTTRQDGLYDVAIRLLGPVCYEIKQEDVTDAGGTIIPELVEIRTRRKYPEHRSQQRGRYGEVDFNKVMSDIVSDNERNCLIVDTVLNGSGPALTLTHRVEHANFLAGILQATGVRAAAFHARVPKKQLEHLDQQFRQGELDVLVATLGLAKEGLDYPHLERLYLVTPMRDPEGVKQAVGRAMRSHPGKAKATVYDFVDDGPAVLKNQAKRRRQVYRKLGMREAVVCL